MIIMNVSKKMTQWGLACGLLLAGLLLAGCQSATPPPAQFSDISALTAPATSATAPMAAEAGKPGSASDSGTSTTDILQPGDSLTITFADMVTQVPPFDLVIPQDGMVTLLLNHQFNVTGKTRSQLQNEIQGYYVPKYFKYMTVIIKPQFQWYFVKGEVKIPNRYQYMGKMTVLRAISSAGDFSEFARKTKVTLIRVNGRIEHVDCIKALNDPRLDLEVNPGDTVNVPRRIL
jgi:polysaccharide export outer membrane protein